MPRLGIPTGEQIKNAGAIPWTSQIPNDSNAGGNTLNDALNAVSRLRGTATGLELQTLNDEVSVVLGGVSTNEWVPTLAIVDISAITGAANGDAEITIGTTSGGTQILAATALTDCNALGEKFVVDLTGVVKASIAANATIYIKCTTADTGAGTALTADVTLIGEIL